MILNIADLYIHTIINLRQRDFLLQADHQPDIFSMRATKRLDGIARALAVIGVNQSRIVDKSPRRALDRSRWQRFDVEAPGQKNGVIAATLLKNFQGHVVGADKQVAVLPILIMG